MKVKVNKDACIGCGACAAICDAIFEIDDDGLSVVKKEEVDEENKYYPRMKIIPSEFCHKRYGRYLVSELIEKYMM